MNSANPANAEIAKVQKNIYMQAGLALLTMVLTVVILFAMTSAWYTNIAQTSGLMFEVEPWGFSGEVVVDQDESNPIKAGPGDDGIIHLKVLRNSPAGNEEEEEVSAILEEAGASAEVTTDIIDVDVKIVKTGMSEDIRKRIFFYVDSPAVINGEQVEKVYVNARESYVYTLFGGSDLVISEDFSNVPELKWEWVYDVLGYYVYGTGTEVNEKLVVTANEYLRPIEYDLDKATFDEDFELLTVDGETTPAEFLNSVFATDGYTVSEGDGYTQQIFGENDFAETGVYYPVKVDENGVGIYAYLCNYAQIVKETETDTGLGNLAYQAAQKDSTLSDEEKAKIRFPAEISVTAQERETAAKAVSGGTELIAALAVDSGIDSVQLESDIALGGVLEIPEGKKILVDLNGHTISTTSTEKNNFAVYAKSGSSVTMTNGTIEGKSASTKAAINSAGAEVNLSSVTIKNSTYGIYVSDDIAAAGGKDSSVRMVNSTVDSSVSYGVLFYGNGETSAQDSSIIIEGCTFYSKRGIYTNGNATSAGIKVTVVDTKINSNTGAGIYNPQGDSSVTIYNSTIEGYTGLAIKGGSIRILGGSVINGIGEKGDPKLSNSGFSDTGDALYIETNYNNDIYIEIENSKLSSQKSNAIQVYNSEEKVKINIVSGTFSTAVKENWVAEGSELGSEQKSVHVKTSEE